MTKRVSSTHAPLGQTLRVVASELARVSQLIEPVEGVLSKVFDSSDHIVLQNLDLIVQNTGALADFLSRISAEVPSTVMIDGAAAAEAVPLEATRRRLLLAEASAADALNARETREQVDNAPMGNVDLF